MPATPQSRDDLARLREYLRVDPVNPMLRHQLAHAHMARSQWIDAMQLLVELLPGREQTPIAQDVRTTLRALHRSGELTAALHAVDALAPSLAGDGEFLGISSLLMLDANRPDDAARMNAQALALHDARLETLACAGSLALGADDAPTARGYFEAALRAQPDDGRCWSGLGMASILAGDLPRAREELARATQCMPGHVGTWIALGWAHLAAGAPDAAVEAFASAIALDRNFAESHGSLAVAQAMRGATPQAQASLDRALRLDSGCMAAVFARMVLSGALTDREGMEQQLQAALRSAAFSGMPALRTAVSRRLGTSPRR